MLLAETTEERLVGELLFVTDFAEPRYAAAVEAVKVVRQLCSLVYDKAVEALTVR